MKKSKWMTMAAVLTLSTTMAMAAPHGGKRGDRHGRERGEFSERFAQKLNLSDTQKQQIREVQSSFREQNKAFFDSMKETRRQMREARQSGDTARMEALKATARSQHEQMKQLRSEQKNRIVALLTPEQRAQFEAMKGERGGRRSHGERNHK